MPEKLRNLAENLKSIREARRLSIEEFSKELDVPKTTLRDLLLDGQTTLHTAIHISDKLGIPLDTLMNGTLTTGQIKRVDGFIAHMDWYQSLSKEKREEARHHFCAILRLMQEGEDG